MEEMDSKWVEGPMVDSVKKRPDYPRHEEPIKRSDIHNKIRLIIGRVLMLVFGICTLITAGASIFYLFVVCLGILGKAQIPIAFMQQVMCVAIPFALFFVSKGSFAWARHLTRPDSKEFV